jgi:signal peptidase I
VFKFLKTLGSIILDFIETIVTALVIFVIFYLFLFQPHQVKGNSMLTGFIDGEFILTNKINYRFSNPKRGDVIVFKAPQNQKYDYIKRIIALPGEEIGLKNGKILINNNLLNESSYLEENAYTQGNHFLPEKGEVIVPPKHYFVIGDNRAHSSDSRDWGFISKEDIVGRAWLRYWPPSRFGFIPTIDW